MTTNKNPYRSKKRDEPRILYPPRDIFEEKKEKPPESETGQLSYRTAGSKFSEIFNGSLIKSNKFIESKFETEIKRISECFDLQYELASHYLWLVYCPIGVQISPVNDIVMPCFHKSMISLASAFHLTRHGLWGSARPLIRNVFESLIIAKFCSVDNTSEVFDKWIDGIDLYLSNAVFKKIESPSIDEFKHFWGMMSDCTHSSVYSSQPTLEIDSHIEDVSVNFVFIEMMLECKYHLLISHMITPQMRYYQDAYKDKTRASELRKLLSKNYSIGKKSMGAGARALIKDYRSTWKIKV